VDISSLIDSLHPLEVKVLLTFGVNPSAVLQTERLAQSTGLEPSQLSMAVEWLLAKSLLEVDTETVTPVVSLTKIGELYFEKYSPIERVLSAARDAAKTGKRLTIQDIQSREGLEPAEVSGAIGRLKKEGTLLIVQGGCIESTARPSQTAEAMRGLLQQSMGRLVSCRHFPKHNGRSFTTTPSNAGMHGNPSALMIGWPEHSSFLFPVSRLPSSSLGKGPRKRSPS
jgi:phenylalanyl-tRNA synthetase alpha chain